jgi:hypothetical protein
MITKIDALLKLKPNAEWTWRGDDYESLNWLDQNQTKPTEQEILDKQAELQADYDAKQYQRDRASEYPQIGDQLDKLWHSINADDTLKTQFADFYNTIKAVKDEYPKE